MQFFFFLSNSETAGSIKNLLNVEWMDLDFNQSLYLCVSLKYYVTALVNRYPWGSSKPVPLGLYPKTSIR